MDYGFIKDVEASSGLLKMDTEGMKALAAERSVEPMEWKSARADNGENEAVTGFS
jgi:hypothetical protein